jgi:hypothetical protein
MNININSHTAAIQQKKKREVLRTSVPAGKTFASAERVADAVETGAPFVTFTDDPKMRDEGIDASAVILPDLGVIFPTLAQMGNMDVMAVGSAILIAVDKSFGARMPIFTTAVQMSQSQDV